MISPLVSEFSFSVQKTVVQRQINSYIGGAAFAVSELVL